MLILVISLYIVHKQSVTMMSILLWKGGALTNAQPPTQEMKPDG